ncbi:hypothetical protein OHA25_41955 [Nonomuraea sp. NBC_00507]|uniref:hypothetical protein n=1 Tax=Nonomuraea sp. NBC_00507 TaxID=2976002 RepID=UPI002E16DD38
MSVMRAKHVVRKAGYIESSDWEPTDEAAHCHLAAADSSGCDWDIVPGHALPQSV